MVQRSKAVKTKARSDTQTVTRTGDRFTSVSVVMPCAAPRTAKLVDPEYLTALDAIADAATEIVGLGMTTARVETLQRLLKTLEDLEPKQDHWRTDKEIEARL